MSNRHPTVLLFYFLAVLMISMFLTNPLILAESFLGALLLLVMLEGWGKALKSLLTILPLLILITLSNPLFSKEGQTVLLSLFGKAISAEALLYGLGIGLMLLGVLLWSRSFALLMTGDKFLYLFGKITPGIALVLSMALRFIPLLRRRFEKISSAQKTMGLYAGGKAKERMQGSMSAFSALMTWSLENDVETGDSMRARGYGLKGRTNFSVFRFKANDFNFALTTILFSALVFYAIFSGRLKFDYYAQDINFAPDALSILTYFSFGLLCLLPFLYELKESLKWKYFVSKI